MPTHGTIHTLLVEDNPQEAHWIHELVAEVASVRFTWEHVARLDEAKDLLRLEPFDLVLLDLFLPDSQGLETFIELYPHALCLPVVVLTRSEDEPLALQAVRSGAQDTLIKDNMQGQAAVRALRQAIERKRIETALRIRNQHLTLLAAQLKPQAKFSTSLDNLAEVFIHELNNPLARMSGQLEELLGQFSSDDPRRAALLSIHAQAEQMGHLVGNLLQASMQNAGQESVAITERLQEILALRAVSTSSEETNFFEALGAWVLDYLSGRATPTSRSRNKHVQQITEGDYREPLSQRELQVVYLVAKGFTNKEIARQLALSVRTVERYSSSVMNKLGMHNRAELITYAVRQGIVNGDEIPGPRRKNAGNK
jgi:DNA-binding NarL/FixJ family response regulator